MKPHLAYRSGSWLVLSKRGGYAIWIDDSLAGASKFAAGKFRRRRDDAYRHEQTRWFGDRLNRLRISAARIGVGR